MINDERPPKLAKAEEQSITFPKEWRRIGESVYRLLATADRCDFRQAMEFIKAATVRASILDCDGNRAMAARRLRLGRQSMYNIIYRHHMGIKPNWRSMKSEAEADDGVLVEGAELPEEPITQPPTPAPDDEFVDLREDSEG